VKLLAYVCASFGESDEITYSAENGKYLSGGTTPTALVRLDYPCVIVANRPV